MIAVLTGDIVSSRQAPDRKWLKRLGEVLDRKSGLSRAPKWGIFRGDGFQVELAKPEEAFQLALVIRAGLKSVSELFDHGIDARIGIGIGKKDYTGKSINESDGEAFQWSGNVLDSLKSDNYKLQIKTQWQDIDDPINIALKFASIVVDEWTHAEAEIAWLLLTQPRPQAELAKTLNITQPAVHKRVAGSHLKELLDLNAFFNLSIRNRIHTVK